MVTPARKQYLDIKAQYPDEILLYRMGDFYETFDDDARKTSRDLDIVLTQREMGQGEMVPLAGIPFHALDNYLAKLLKKGHRVAIAEQISVPDGKRIVSHGLDKGFNVWDANSGELLETLKLNVLLNNMESKSLTLSLIDNNHIIIFRRFFTLLSFTFFSSFFILLTVFSKDKFL